MANKISGSVARLILGTVYHRGYATMSVVFACVSVAVAGYFFQNIPNAGDDELRVTFLDIGQGDSILIDAPNGNSMMIDSGPVGGKVLVESSKQKSFFDKNIDVALITHGDADHIGSMVDVLKKYSVSMFVSPGVDAGTKLYENLMEYSAEQISQNLIAVAGMKIVLDETRGVYLKILSPNFLFQIDTYEKCTEIERQKHARKQVQKMSGKLSPEKAPVRKALEFAKSKRAEKTAQSKCLKSLQLETNQNSIVGELVYGSTTFLLTGDAPSEIEKYLIENLDRAPTDSPIGSPVDQAGEFSRSFLSRTTNVLKLGHHGSKTSTSEEFLKFVNPKFAVISAGKDNRYGHPNAETMSRLNAFASEYNSSPPIQDNTEKFEILRTDQSGSVTLVSDGVKVWQAKY